MADAAVITAHGLKKFFGRRAVLDQLDLTVERGAAIGLLGSNGAGKTTLLQSLLGLIPLDAGRCAVLLRSRGVCHCAVLAHRRAREWHLSTVAIVILVIAGALTLLLGDPHSSSHIVYGAALMLVPPAAALAWYLVNTASTPRR